PVERARRAGEEADVVGADRHLVARVRERLADVPRLELRELLGVLVDRVRELQEQLGPLAGRRLEPFGKRLLRGLDCAVDVLGARARHLGDRLAGRGIQDLHGLAVGRVDPLAADEVLVRGNGRAHGLPPYVLRRTPVSRVRRCAIVTGRIVSTITKKTTTFTCGSCCPRRRLPRIQIGRVFCEPAGKVVTITSSSETANASSAPPTSAVEITGSVTKRKVCHPSAPRSIDASVSETCVRRIRAATLL